MLNAIQLATAMHPLLMQGDSKGPVGEHTSVKDVDAEFPHIDEDGTCWQPVGYDPDDEPGDKWVDYEDSTSEIMRADCDTQDWLEVCQIPLDWEEVNCDGTTGEAAEKTEEDGAVEEEGSGGLPRWIVLPVQFMAWIAEMHVVTIITLPWWSIIFLIALFDYALDIAFFILFGWYCGFCAGLFIWAVNLVHLPFSIWGFLQQVFLEIFSFIIDGWMLLFGSGCFIFIGPDCYLQGWSTYLALDIPWFTRDKVAQRRQSLRAKLDEKLTIPQINSPMEFWTVREKHRAEFMSMIPLVGDVYNFARLAAQYIEL